MVQTDVCNRIIIRKTNAGFSVIPVINAFGTSKIKNSFVTVLTSQNGPKLKSLLEFTSRSISFILFSAQNDQA